jgi:carboxyl-terminal processing protease
MKVAEGITENIAVPPAPTKSRWSLIVVTLIIGLGVGFWGGRQATSVDKLDYRELDEIYSVLQDNYDGEIDQKSLIDGAKKGMVAGLGDPYTQYFTRVDAKEFNEDLEGEFFGVGIELDNKDGGIVIVDVLDGTPAEKAGLLAGDYIIKVDDTDVADWASEEAVKVIRGEAGSQVKLTVLRDGFASEFEITRGKISNPSVKSSIQDGYGVLSISRFGDTDTVRLAKAAAQEFVDKKVKGVVLDLRGNGGGYVSAAVDVASLWVDKGEIITTEKVGQITSDTEKAVGGNILKGIPTVVLVDGGSASASEIVAGALQDYGLATVAGAQSFGKGSVQVMKPLRGGDQLKITIARWYTPHGNNIDKEGIKPDIEIEFDTEAYKNGTDNQLQKAIEILK